MCGPSLWNSLPADITEAPTVDQFKTKLKTHMFRDIYDKKLLVIKPYMIMAYLTISYYLILYFKLLYFI